MPEADIIIQSGLLYEGSDYGTWLEKIKLLLAHKMNLDDGEVEDLDDLGLSSSEQQEAIDVLRAYASKHVLQRVPDYAKKRPGRFLQSLKGLAKPFRFAELPDHVQIRVCRILLPSRFTIYSETRKPMLDSPFPPILHTSRRLRRTFLPIFYRETTFGMYCYMSRNKSDQERRQIAANAAQNFRTWVYQIVPQPNTRWLRKLELWGGLGITFELTEKKGASKSSRQFEITFSTTHQLTADSQKLLKEHVSATDKYRKACGKEGEGLILVLTSNPELWAEMEEKH